MNKFYSFLILVFFVAASSNGQAINNIHVTVKGGAEIIVSDSLGRRTGIDPITGITYQEIPNSGYGDEGVDSEDSTVADLYYTAFDLKRATSGVYEIKVIGAARDAFALTIFMTRGVSAGESFYFSGPTLKGSVSYYRVVYDTDTTRPISAYPITIPHR